MAEGVFDVTAPDEGAMILMALFTGSSDTAQKLRGHARVVAASVRVNIEADSINAALLAGSILALNDPALAEALDRWRARQTARSRAE